MAGQIIEQFDHQVELREALDKVFLVCFVLFEVDVQSLKEISMKTTMIAIIIIVSE